MTERGGRGGTRQEPLYQSEEATGRRSASPPDGSKDCGCLQAHCVCVFAAIFLSERRARERKPLPSVTGDPPAGREAGVLIRCNQMTQNPPRDVSALRVFSACSLSTSYSHQSVRCVPHCRQGRGKGRSDWLFSSASDCIRTETEVTNSFCSVSCPFFTSNQPHRASEMTSRWFLRLSLQTLFTVPTRRCNSEGADHQRSLWFCTDGWLVGSFVTLYFMQK